MKRKYSRKKRKQPKTVLRLPDLEVARTSVLQSLSSPDSQRGYRHAIDEFVDWYCSEPRLAFNKTVVVRYRSFLESGLSLRARTGRVIGPGITAKAVWHVVKQAARAAGISKLAPHDLRRYAECPIMPN